MNIFCQLLREEKKDAVNLWRSNLLCDICKHTFFSPTIYGSQFWNTVSPKEHTVLLWDSLLKMLTVYESTHLMFWNNVPQAKHWEIEIRHYKSLDSFLKSNPGTLVERVCQCPLAKQSDSFMKLPCSCISFVFLSSSQNWRLRCSPKKAVFMSSFMNLVPYFREQTGLKLPWTAPYFRL